MASSPIRRSPLLALPRRVYRSVRRRLRNRLYGPAVESASRELLARLAAHPVDPDGHYRLARFYLEHGRQIAAAAECRTSLTFGGGPAAQRLLSAAYASGHYDGPGLFALPSFVYQRINGLASKISERFPNFQPSVLDVGGGDGFLSLFLRECDYALAEPSVNGLLVTHFPARSFDVVAACHVFEHIPPEQKDEFLKSLCSVARRLVLLLGPLETDTKTTDATPLVYRITKAPWAREHLECGIPPLDLITRFAAEHGIPCRVSPSGNRLSVYWAVFADYFATCAHKREELREVERFANEHMNTDLVHAADPNEYMIELDLERQETRA